MICKSLTHPQTLDLSSLQSCYQQVSACSDPAEQLKTLCTSCGKGAHMQTQNVIRHQEGSASDSEGSVPIIGKICWLLANSSLQLCLKAPRHTLLVQHKQQKCSYRGSSLNHHLIVRADVTALTFGASYAKAHSVIVSFAASVQLVSVLAAKHGCVGLRAQKQPLLCTGISNATQRIPCTASWHVHLMKCPPQYECLYMTH